jgi:hypothetical protein
VVDAVPGAQAAALVAPDLGRTLLAAAGAVSGALLPACWALALAAAASRVPVTGSLAATMAA